MFRRIRERRPRRLAAAVLATAMAVAAAAPARAVGRFGAEDMGGWLAEAWRWLASVWAEEGEAIDPNGRIILPPPPPPPPPPSPGGSQPLWVEEGEAVDPNGSPALLKR